MKHIFWKELRKLFLSYLLCNELLVLSDTLVGRLVMKVKGQAF